jgi:RNA polymerase sigma-70 factor (ECF subfamily)
VERPRSGFLIEAVKNSEHLAYLFPLSWQYPSVTDSALLRDAHDGNESAFLAIYHEHRLPVYQFAWRLTGSATAAEDVTQECFLSLMRGAAFDSRRGNLRTYLFGTARNLVLRRLRTNTREAEAAADAPASIDILGDLLETERSELIAGAIAQLPILQREALVLFTFDELSLDQIAQITGVDTGAVKSRLYRARESLRAALSPLLTPCSERKKS